MDLYSSGKKLVSVNIAVIRPDPLFEPVVMGDTVKNGHVEIDATNLESFILTIQNPTGSPWRRFKLRDCSDKEATACTDPHAVAADTAGTSIPVGLVFSPSSFALAPGKAQSVVVQVPGSLGQDPHARFLQIADADDATLETTTLVVIKKLTSTKTRTEFLLLAVILGAFISVALNNIFPASWAKSEVQGALQRVTDMLSGCALLGHTLRDVLSSEIGRNRLIVRGMRFYHLRKDSVIQEVQQATVVLVTLTIAAKGVNTLRSQIESCSLAVRTKLAVGDALNAAEEALIGFDLATAALKVTDATRIAAAGSQSATLAAELADDIKKLLSERGNTRSAQAESAARTLDVIKNSEVVAIAGGRSATIAQLVAQLERDLSYLKSMKLGELLEVERDFYIADAWTEFVEPAIESDKARFEGFAIELLECLKRNPISEHVQILLALVRSSLTPHDIRAALSDKAASIDCHDFPRYLDLIDCRFVFSNPCIQSVTAARRLASYQWNLNDGSEPPEDFESCKHYFVPPRLQRLRSYFKLLRAPSTRTITVGVTVPGSAASKVVTFERTITLRGRAKRPSELGMLQFMNFVLSTSIAVLAAFAAQYGSVLPDAIDWKTGVAAFMFGFGIDQIRDKATTSPSVSIGSAASAFGAPQSLTPPTTLAQGAPSIVAKA
jgi:hypothetical protein